MGKCSLQTYYWHCALPLNSIMVSDALGEFFFVFKLAGGSFSSASSVLPEGNCSAYCSLQTLFPWVMQIV